MTRSLQDEPLNPLKEKEWLIPLIAAAGIVALYLLYRYNPAMDYFFPPCPFHAFTGLYCPGCGTLRAMHQLLNGHFVQAFRLNPLMVILLPFLAWLAHNDYMVPASRRTMLSGPVIWAIFILLVGYGVLRNIPVYPFTLLAPFNPG